MVMSQRSFEALWRVLCSHCREMNQCQPNYRRRVLPDPTTSCGPYHLPGSIQKPDLPLVGRENGGESAGGGGEGRHVSVVQHAQHGQGMDSERSESDRARGKRVGRNIGMGSQKQWSVKGTEAPKAAHSVVDVHNHDTIAMVVVDSKGSIAAGASSNGANHKACPAVTSLNILSIVVHAKAKQITFMCIIIASPSVNAST